MDTRKVLSGLNAPHNNIANTNARGKKKAWQRKDPPPITRVPTILQMSEVHENGADTNDDVNQPLLNQTTQAQVITQPSEPAAEVVTEAQQQVAAPVPTEEPPQIALVANLDPLEAEIAPETQMADDNIENSLITAALNKNVELVKQLIESKADVHAKNQEGHTALYLVADLYRPQNVLDSASGQKIALDLHGVWGAIQIAALLLKAGAIIDETFFVKRPEKIICINQLCSLVYGENQKEADVLYVLEEICKQHPEFAASAESRPLIHNSLSPNAVSYLEKLKWYHANTNLFPQNPFYLDFEMTNTIEWKFAEHHPQEIATKVHEADNHQPIKQDEAPAVKSSPSPQISQHGTSKDKPLADVMRLQSGTKAAQKKEEEKQKQQQQQTEPGVRKKTCMLHDVMIRET